MSLVVIVSQGWMCLWKMTLRAGWRNLAGGGLLQRNMAEMPILHEKSSVGSTRLLQRLFAEATHPRRVQVMRRLSRNAQ